MKNKAIIFGIGLGLGAAAGFIREHKRMENVLMEKIKKIDIFQRYKSMLLAWLKLYEDNITFDSFFDWYGAENIAVYGNGQIGKCFMSNMKNTQCRIDYIIDRNAAYMSTEIPIMTIADELPQVDAIVVTVIDDFDNIEEEIRKRYNYSVISIEDVIFGSM